MFHNARVLCNGVVIVKIYTSSNLIEFLIESKLLLASLSHIPIDNLFSFFSFLIVANGFVYG